MNKIVKILLVVLCVLSLTYIILTNAVFATYKIQSNNMYPTLKPGDIVYGYRFAYINEEPRRGDVVVFLMPLEKERRFIVKRIVGLPGENVGIKSGKIYVNGVKIRDKYIDKTHYYNRGKYGEENTAVKVPEGHFYILGDNSTNSLDSRYWGFVPRGNILSKVITARMGNQILFKKVSE